MKIKQVEELVGITSKNIRFYESQGLISPDRSENGYRDYHEKHVETLKRIKFLRKLGVSVEDIRLLLEEKRDLSDCLEKQIINMKKQEADLVRMQQLASAVIAKKETLAGIDIDQWLDEMEHMEKEGVDFVNLSKIDIHMKKKLGAGIGGGVMILLMLFIIGLILWGNSQDPIPLPLLLFLIGLPVLMVITILIVLHKRFKEIEGGEEDEASKY